MSGGPIGIPRNLRYPAGRPAGLDFTHPMFAGLDFAAVCLSDGATMVSLIDGSKGATTGAITSGFAPSIGPGVQVSTTTGSSNRITFSGGPTTAPTEVTIAALVGIDTQTTSAINTVILNTGGANGIGFGWHGSSNDWSIFNNGSFSKVLGLGPLVVNQRYFMVMSFNSATDELIVLARNLLTGEISEAATTSTITPSAPNGTIVVGNLGTATASAMVGNIAAVMFGHIFYDITELKAWSNDPWPLWYRPSTSLVALFKSAGTISSSTASATGTGAATAVGSSTAASSAAASGIGAAVGVGASTWAGAGSAVGTGAANAVATAITVIVGSAAGVGAATGTGTAIDASIASATGTGAAAAIGASTAASTGAAAGTGAATGVGRATAASVGSASGVGTGSGISAGGVGVGEAAGTGAASAASVTFVAGVGSASGAGTANASGPSTGSGSAIGTGVAGAIGVGETVQSAVAAASGIGTAAAVGRSTAGSIGASSGIGVALGQGLQAANVGSAAGVGSAAAVSAVTVGAVGNAPGIGVAIGVAAPLALVSEYDYPIGHGLYSDYAIRAAKARLRLTRGRLVIGRR